MEKRSDMYLSTLRSYVEAMVGPGYSSGVPDGEVVLERFSDVKEEHGRLSAPELFFCFEREWNSIPMYTRLHFNVQAQPLRFHYSS